MYADAIYNSIRSCKIDVFEHVRGVTDLFLHLAEDRFMPSLYDDCLARFDVYNVGEAALVESYRL